MSTNARALLLVGLILLAGVMWALSFASKRLEQVAAGSAPLEPRKFGALTLVAAGTGGTYESHLRLGPCIGVGLGETLVLVDAGRGTAQALRHARIPVEQPRAVLLTSLLPENTLGLDDWLWGVSLAGGGARQVIGPPGTRTLVDGPARRARGRGARGRGGLRRPARPPRRGRRGGQRLRGTGRRAGAARHGAARAAR